MKGFTKKELKYLSSYSVKNHKYDIDYLLDVYDQLGIGEGFYMLRKDYKTGDFVGHILDKLGNYIDVLHDFKGKNNRKTKSILLKKYRKLFL